MSLRQMTQLELGRMQDFREGGSRYGMSWTFPWILGHPSPGILLTLRSLEMGFSVF